MKPSVSILIPTYNRHEILVDTLKGVLLQTYSPLEIVVYDQTDAHPPAVTEFLESHSDRIRWERGEPRGLVSAYAECANRATSDIFLFLDDDIFITDPQLVDKHVAALAPPDVGAVMGKIEHEDQVTFPEIDPRIHLPNGWRFVKFDYDQPVESMPSLGAANMSISREVFQKVAGFDQTYKGNGFRFETDFSLKIRAENYRIPFIPEATIVHRYHSPGGAANSNLENMAAEANDWYLNFFHNTFYFLFKWNSCHAALKESVCIWRDHAFNRAIFRHGLAQIIKRNRLFFSQLKMGRKLAKEARRG